MNSWRYDLECPGRDAEWEEGFESYDDAYEAMSERMTEIINEIAEEHPEMTDAQIEETIDWDVRET